MKANDLRKYPIEVRIPPAIMRGREKSWVVAGCMIPVPRDTTIEEIGKWVVYVPPKPPTNAWDIPSSSGGSYKVHRWPDDRWTCSCPGYKFHQRCKHITRAQELAA